jgi:hypothetical protein
MPVLICGSSMVIWRHDIISSEELKACFPSASGIVVIQASTKEAITAQEGKFLLSSDEQYTIPASVNQG